MRADVAGLELSELGTPDTRQLAFLQQDKLTYSSRLDVV